MFLVYIVTSSSSFALFKQFADVIANLSACSEIIPTESVPDNIKTISDTIGNYGVVLLEMQGKDSDTDKSHLEKKIEKLTKEFEKLHNTVSDEGYKSKAPENVQIQHNKKV